MGEVKFGRRNLIGDGVKSLALGASATVLAGSMISNQAAAYSKKCGEYSLEKYLEYLDAFNRDGRGKGNADFVRFYTDDVTFERGQNHTMRGIEPIVDFFTEMFEHVRQELQLLNFASSENFIASEVKSHFYVLKDWKHDSGAYLKKGREFSSRDFMHYSVHNGLISQVRLVNFRRFKDNKKR